MKRFTLAALCGMLITASTSATSFAHDGKRQEIVVVDNQLAGQGYLFASDGNPTDDGGGIVRPYRNAIHSHFAPLRTGGPYLNVLGFDLFEATTLNGFDVTITLKSAGKWANPPAQDGTRLAQDFGQPVLSPLDVNETIDVGFGTQPSITTDSLGSFTLIDSVSGPEQDIDLTAIADFDPRGSLYFLEWQLSTNAPGIAASNPLYTIMSPPGDGPVERLHFQSLWLERSLAASATAVPEPGSFSMLALGSVIGLRRRRQLLA